MQADSDLRISSLLDFASSKLESVSSTPRLDAEILLMTSLGASRAYVLAHPKEEVSPSVREKFQSFLDQRAQHIPVAYITGEKEFYGLSFEVNTRVLIPRPETELLVEQAIQFLEKREDPLRVFDLGTGSGCIAVAIASWMKEKQRQGTVIAVDRIREVLAVAERNSQKHGVENYIRFVKSNWFSELKDFPPADLIVSNPPYISASDSNRSRSTFAEPEAALISGESGMEAIDLLIEQAASFLGAEGVLLIEHGWDQREQIAETCKRLQDFWGHPPSFQKDLSGLDRVVRLQRSAC